MLGDLVTFQRGHDLPKTQFKDGPYPVAGSNGIIGFHNEFTTRGPGVTIGRSGNIGNAFFYERDFWAHNTSLYVKEFHGSHPRFVYYLLKNFDLAGHNSGSAVPSLNRNYIHPLEVIAPQEIEEQKAIAKILSDLDAKIELNHQMNKTLEQIAQAIFKQWFVDFEFLGHEKAKFVDGVPEGWEEKPLDQIADFLNGLALQKFPPRDEDFLPVIKIRELNQGVTESSDKASSEINPAYIVDDGDVLFSWSGSLDVVIWGHGKGALNQHLFKVTSQKYPKWFYYFWIREHLPEFRLIAEGKATTTLLS